MKVNEALTALIHFFNDLIAHIIPGMIGFGGVLAVLGNTQTIELVCKLHWSILIGIFYVVGHFLLAINQIVYKSKLMEKHTINPKYLVDTPVVKQFTALLTQMSKPDSTEGARDGNTLNSELGFNDLRSIAMSINAEAGDLGRRFMFISLFCKGTATAVFFIGITFTWQTCNFQSLKAAGFTVLPLIVTCLICYIFHTRSEEFHRRALLSPFSVAIADMISYNKQPKAT